MSIQLDDLRRDVLPLFTDNDLIRELAIVREDGNWPADKLRLIEITIMNTLGFVRAEDILDALAEAAREKT